MNALIQTIKMPRSLRDIQKNKDNPCSIGSSHAGTTNRRKEEGKKGRKKGRRQGRKERTKEGRREGMGKRGKGYFSSVFY